MQYSKSGCSWCNGEVTSLIAAEDVPSVMVSQLLSYGEYFGKFFGHWFVLFLTALFPLPVHAVVKPCNYLSETCGAERRVWFEERSFVETASLTVACRMRAGVMMDMRSHHHRFLRRGRRYSRVRGPLRPQGLWYRLLHRRRRSGMTQTLRMNREVRRLSRPNGCQEVCRHFVISARRRGDSPSVCCVVLVRACSSSVLLHVCVQDLVCLSRDFL